LRNNSNLYLTIIDNHPINKQFHQLATLGEGQVVERRPEAVAEGVDAMRQGQDIDLLLCLCLDLPELLAHTYHLKNLGLKVHPLVGCHERGKLT